VRDLCTEDPEERPSAADAQERLARVQPPGPAPRLVSPARPRETVESAPLPPLESTEVPPGQFSMSDVRTVEITVPLAVGPPVTRLLWHRVMRLDDPLMTHEGIDDVSWLQAIEFCNAMSVREGLTTPYTLSDLRPRKAYSIDDIGRMLLAVLPKKRRDAVLAHFGTDALTIMQFEPQRLTQLPGIGPKTAERYGRQWPGDKYFVRDVAWDRSADGYRLPTEAEWVHGVAEPDRDEWTWDADPGPPTQAVATPLAEGHHVDPALDDGVLRIVRSRAGRSVLALHKRREGLGFRVVRGARP
ncbi:MAG: hypothetical protein AAF602_31960, partial [Myxococcota bacterium]